MAVLLPQAAIICAFSVLPPLSDHLPTPQADRLFSLQIQIWIQQVLKLWATINSALSPKLIWRADTTRSSAMMTENGILFYHTRFDDGAEFHEVRVHSMYFNEQGWPVVAPYEYSGDDISETGYNDEDIAGDYEFINHGTSTDGKIINYSSIKLNSDGTISGAVTGKWSQAKDNSEAEIIIGNQAYIRLFPCC